MLKAELGSEHVPTGSGELRAGDVRLNVSKWGKRLVRRFLKEGHVFYVSQCCVSNKTYISKCFAIEGLRQQMGFGATRLLLCERMVKTQQGVANSAPPF